MSIHEGSMTKAQAQELRQKWGLRIELQACKHMQVSLEFEDRGRFTGKYVCLMCGANVLKAITLSY